VALTGYLIDTSVIHRLADPTVGERVETLAAKRPLYRCAVVELEVLRSATSPHDYEGRRTALSNGYTDLPITPQVMARALETQRQLATASQHRGVSLPDLIIAACAEVHGATVVHYDADYDRIAAMTGQPVEWVVPRTGFTPPPANAEMDQPQD
jgi:predicted nucleic acid-binding protein